MMRKMASGRIRLGCWRRTQGLLVALLALILAQAAQAQNGPTVTAPAEGSSVIPTPTLNWDPVTGATWYRVWLSGTGSNGPNVLPCAFNSGAVDPGGCWVQSIPLTVTSPLAEGAYTLWVQAWSPSQAGWSTARAFTVAKRFVDKGNTVLDRQTGLEWEKKTDDGSVNDKDNFYTWSATGTAPDGTAFTQHLAAMNGPCVSASSDGFLSGLSGMCPGFGHSDWRLPTVFELNTINDCSQGAPCIDPIFGPTASGEYWSSSSAPTPQPTAWTVNFSSGSRVGLTKGSGSRVRAVRGGL